MATTSFNSMRLHKLEPYHEGYEDGYNGDPCVNPYEMNSRQWEAYDDGYADGRETREEEGLDYDS